jgi:hypothetical protein
MRRSQVLTLYVLTLVTVGLVAPTGLADEIVWSINASVSFPHIVEIDVSTNQLLTNFVAPTADPLVATANGRGLAYNNATGVIYYGFATTSGGLADDGKIYETNAAGQDLGVLFNTGLAGISTLTFDGTHLWVTSASPIPSLDNNIYEYSLTGTLLGTFSGLGDLRDGVTIANGFFLGNQGQGKGPYDQYQLVGSTLKLVSPAFINPVAAVPSLIGTLTGITWDGTDYFVSNPSGYGIGTQGIMVFDSSGHFLTEVRLPDPGPQPTGSGSTTGWLLENLAAVTGSGTPAVPEPASVMLLGTVVLLLSRHYIRRRQK